MQYILGIDPGKEGGLAILRDGKCIDTLVMPLSGKELNLGKVAEWIYIHDRPFDLNRDFEAIIEKAHAMPKQGVTSMFKFGFATGALHGILAAYDIPYRVVTPQEWKKVILSGTAKDKDAARDYVMRAYPEIKLVPDGCKKPHSGLCDAICIAEYGRKRQ